MKGVSETERSLRRKKPKRRMGLERREGKNMFRAIADVLRQIGGAIATVVTLPFRALARLFGGASDSAHRSGRTRRA